MFKRSLFVGLAFLAAACVPITPEAPATPEALQTPEPTQASESARGPSMIPASENFADCLDGDVTDATSTQVVVDYLEMLPGQRANDPSADNIPDYVDIIGVESNLDGETLTVVFFLRGIPKELEFNRKGADKMSPEYMWMVHIDVDGENESERERYEYTFGAFANIIIRPTETPTTTHLFEDGVKIRLWEHMHDHEENVTRLIEAPVNPRLFVSHEDNTLTLISEVPGITSESMLMFSTFDTLLGHDSISCQPG